MACWDQRYQIFYTFTNFFIELEQNKKLVPLDQYVKKTTFPTEPGGRD